MTTSIRIATALFLLFAVATKYADGVSVMSIDLGSEFMKIGIVKPGVPMEIVLNKESRRKTPLAVSLRSPSEREFGEMALSQSIKNPKTAYLYITQILAKSLDNPAVKEYKEKYPFYDIKEDPATKTIYFQHDSSTTYTPEELLSMILDYARDLAADFGEQSIDAAVIAVPEYFNQAERKAVLRAAQIVDLKVLQLINTNTAAGLNYGVFRRKDFNSTPTTLMFFDMGSTSTTATVASFHLVKMKDDYEANPQLTIRGVGFDSTLGGNAFSLRLAKHLAKIFAEKTKKDVFTNPKAILKLYKEADRVKSVLSANADHNAQVEGLMDDVDFKAKVTREELETMCADLFDRIKKPIEDAIKSAEILPEEISAVILVGGGTRIPKVQDELMKATKKTELGKYLNTDEAPALGAVYQAAFQSKGYKVKKFYVKDYNQYPIVVDFERFGAEGADGMIRRTLFDRSNPFPQKKVMTFSKHTSDFNFDVNYGDLSYLSQSYVKKLGSLNLTQIKLNGVKSHFEKHENQEYKGIKVHFKLDDSGVLRVEKADITFEKSGGEGEAGSEESTLSKISNTISSFFGSKNDEGTEEKSTENQETTTEQTTTESIPVNSTTTAENLNSTLTNSTLSKNGTATQNATIYKDDVEYEMVQLDFVELDKSRLAEVRSKLNTIKEKEKERRKKAAAINSLEAFIFDTKDKLEQDEFIKCSTQEERDKIREKLDEADMWLSDADDSVETKVYNEKLTSLKALTRDIFYRLNEKQLRPKKLDDLKEILNRSSDFLSNTRNMTGEDLPLTETEWNTLDKLINSTKEWRVKMLNEQAKVADHEEPKLLSKDITDKVEALKREVNYLLSKIKYFRPKKKATDEKVKNATSTNEKPKKESDQTSQDDQSEQSDKANDEKDQKEPLDNEEFYYETDQEKATTPEDDGSENQEDATTDSTSTTNNPEL